MSIQHHVTIKGSEKDWAVDPPAAGRVMPWIARRPDVFAADLNGMAHYFPHWLLVGGRRDRPLRCSRCAAFYAPYDGGLHCLACGAQTQADQLLWIGHLPVPARPEDPFQRRRQALQAAGFPETTIDGAAYLLVPLTVGYPSEWPNVEPTVRYARRWLDLMGLPHSSGAHHLVGGGKACLFYWGHWQAMPVQAVLQQRVVNHTASLFKIAAGQIPQQAFIGRVHNRQWEPDR